MSVQVLMPRLSDSMESGVVCRWLRADGDRVACGEALVEVETDKSTVELLAEADGVLVIRAAEGSTVEAGAPIADIRDLQGATAEAGASIADPPAAAAPARRLLATPAARKLARQAGLSLVDLVPGSGPGGRIQRHDVERRLVGREPAAGEVVTPSRVHLIAAERLAAAKREIPHYYATVEVEATAAIAASADREVGLTDVIAYCTAGALRALPEVNASWADGTIVRHGRVDIGIAVSLDDGGLLVPVLREADRKPLRELAGELRSLVERARRRALGVDELAGGTFTISNLGMYGVTEFHAIINPPQSGILAVGAVRDRVALRGGAVVALPTLTLSLSADHRVYAGVAAARFLGEIRRRLESVERP